MSLIQALTPFINILQLFGFTPFEITKPNTFYIYNIVATLSLFITTSIIIYRIITTEIAQITQHNTAVLNVNLIQMNLFRFAHVLILIESIVKQKYQKLFFQQIQSIDQLLMDKYGIEINYKSLRRYININLICFGAIYLLCLTSIIIYRIFASQINNNSNNNNNNNYHSVTIWQYIGLLYNLTPFLLISLRYFQIIMLMSLIRDRFGHLNYVLENIDLCGKGIMLMGNLKIGSGNQILLVAEYQGQQRKTENNNKRIQRLRALDQLLIVRDLYDRLWDLTQLINACFGWSLLINTANDFISITSNCYLIFLLAKFGLSDIMRIVSSVCWTIPHIINLLGITHLCSTTIKKVCVL